MGKFIETDKTSEFSDGTKKIFKVEGQDILIARIKDEFYAVSNLCTHMGGDLSAGNLDGTIITCPRHGSQFDLRDGRVIRWLKGSGLFSAIGKVLKSPNSLKTYNVKIEGEKILVEI